MLELELEPTPGGSLPGLRERKQRSHVEEEIFQETLALAIEELDRSPGACKELLD